jgi:Ser/Thr protein kinase RdoA (MazF antagonist)
LLKLFGAQYSAGGTVVFQLLALSTFAIAGNSIGNNIMNIERRSGGIIIVQGAIALVTIAIAWPLMRFGLVGVGFSFLIGNVVGNIVQLILLSTKRRKTTAVQAAQSASGLVPSKAIMYKFLTRYGLDTAEVGRDVGNGDRSGTTVVTTTRHKYVLKVYNSNKRTSKQLKEELNFMSVLSKKGVPVPQIARASDNSEVVELTISGTSWVGVLMNYEAGVHPTEMSEKLVANMARTQGLIHEVGQLYDGTRGGLESDNGSLRGSLIGFAPRGVSHFDYDHTNILTDGDNISCVLDFEGMRYDPLVVCIFYTLTALYSTSPDVDKLKLYLRSYQEVRPLSRIEKRIIRTGLALRYRNLRLFLLNF